MKKGVVAAVNPSTSRPDYFSLLDIPESVDLDTGLLTQNYFALQRRYHPDKAKNPTERLHFMQLSADANAAYRTLKSEESRLFYLMSLKGYDLLSENSPYQLPPMLLMESLEWREKLESVQGKESFSLYIQQLEQFYATLIAEAKASIIDNNPLQAVELLLRLRYVTKILQECRHKRLHNA